MGILTSLYYNLTLHYTLTYISCIHTEQYMYICIRLRLDMMSVRAQRLALRIQITVLYSWLTC